MIKLEQVQLLESRVEKALALIDRLKGENLGLRDKLTGYQKRIEDLEALVRELQSEQGRIEEGILSALTKLNRFEDSLEAEGRGKEQPKPAGPAPKATGAAPEQAARHEAPSGQEARVEPAEKPAAKPEAPATKTSSPELEIF